MIGDSIKNIRFKYNLTQEQMARKLNVSRKTISAWENNRNTPDLSLLKQISMTFGIPLSSLLSNSELTHNNQKKEKIILFYLYGVQILLIILEYFTLFNLINIVLTTIFIVINTIVISVFRHSYLIMKRTTHDLIIRKVILFTSILINTTLSFRHVIFSFSGNFNNHNYTLGVITGKTVISVILSFAVLSIYDLKFLKGGDF